MKLSSLFIAGLLGATAGSGFAADVVQTAFKGRLAFVSSTIGDLPTQGVLTAAPRYPWSVGAAGVGERAWSALSFNGASAGSPGGGSQVGPDGLDGSSFELSPKGASAGVDGYADSLAITDVPGLEVYALLLAGPGVMGFIALRRKASVGPAFG